MSIQNNESVGRYPRVTMSKGAGEPIVTDYSTRLIQRYVDAGGQLKALGTKGGVAASALTQIKGGTLGVGGALMRGIARAFELDVPDLVADAYAWDRAGRPSEFEAPSEGRDLAKVLERSPGRWEPVTTLRALEYESAGLLPRDGWPRWLDAYRNKKLPPALRAARSSHLRSEHSADEVSPMVSDIGGTSTAQGRDRGAARARKRRTSGR